LVHNFSTEAYFLFEKRCRVLITQIIKIVVVKFLNSQTVTICKIIL